MRLFLVKRRSRGDFGADVACCSGLNIAGTAHLLPEPAAGSEQEGGIQKAQVSYLLLRSSHF